MQKEKVWKEIVRELGKDLDQTSLSSWFSSLKLKSLDKNTIVIEAPNRFVFDWVKHHYQDKLLRAAKGVVGKNIKLQYDINPGQGLEPDGPVRPGSLQAPAPIPGKKTRRPHPGLNPKYTFDNFVVGRSNQFAHAACLAVAENHARNYNPLFIYGGVGLGKTHLLNAIGNHLYQHNPRKKIICSQAEEFLNDMIHAIRSEKIDAFRKCYRKECDVLLMDDIEILAGKERTQEEFFYTFNYLYSAGKKIIITSDKFPKEMTTLEERLRSRFESGILVDIQPPEFETRLSIIKDKAKKDQIFIPDNVAMYMAERIKSNVRKIEGCLIRLSAISSISGSPITEELVEEVLHAILDDDETRLTPEKIIKVVSSYFKVKVSDLKSAKRNRKYTVPRHIAMYFCRELCKMSFPEIGSFFGGRDHSTVIHSYRKIGIEKNTQIEISRHLDALKRKLRVVD